jgi:hypothetical protein
MAAPAGHGGALLADILVLRAGSCTLTVQAGQERARTEFRTKH